MLIRRVGYALPFTREQVFDVVADIERYPDVLPFWISASILRREVNTCYVEQVLGRGPLRVKFSSEAVLTRPERLDITSSDASFRQFTLSMLIRPSLPAGCTLSISAQVELRSPLLQKILSQVLSNSIDDVLIAFDMRAHRVYDRPAC